MPDRSATSDLRQRQQLQRDSRLPRLAASGVATLAAGTVAVLDSAVKLGSHVHLTPQTGGSNRGWVRESSRDMGTFTILSSNALDAGDVAWLVLEPSP